MENGILDLLVNGSPMAAFAGFLIYLYRTQQSRMDALTEKFQDQIEKIRKEYKDDVTELRSRYDTVISGQNNEKERIHMGIEEQLKDVQKTLTNVQQGLSTLTISHEVVKDEVMSISKDLESGLKLIQTMQDEAKLRNIAKGFKS